MRCILIIVASCFHIFSLKAQAETDYAPKELIYGRKDGMALTMVMLSPPGEKNYQPG